MVRVILFPHNLRERDSIGSWDYQEIIDRARLSVAPLTFIHKLARVCHLADCVDMIGVILAHYCMFSQHCKKGIECSCIRYGTNLGRGETCALSCTQCIIANIYLVQHMPKIMCPAATDHFDKLSAISQTLVSVTSLKSDTKVSQLHPK